MRLKLGKTHKQLYSKLSVMLTIDSLMMVKMVAVVVMMNEWW